MTKNYFLFLILALTFNTISFSQTTADFENETIGATQFTINGEVFTLTGDFSIVEYTNFSCDGSNSGNNKCIDTGYGNGSSSGIIGSIIAPANTTFQLSTSTTQCVWVGTGDGNFFTTGTVRYIGTKTDNSTIQEDFTIVSLNYTNLNSFTFSSAIWNGINLKQLSLEIISDSNMDYVAFDNLAFNTFTLSTNKDYNYTTQEIQICQNPTSDFIEIKGLKKAIDYKIFNVLGSEIKSGTIANQEKIDIRDLTSGLYFLNLGNEKKIKFIKE